MSSTTLSRANKPRYPSAVGLGLRILVSGLFMPVHTPPGPVRSFRDDVRPLVADIIPPLRVFGEEHIPLEGPCLFLTNHYYRPGFDAWWVPMAISSSVPVEIRWVMTEALTYPGQKRGLIMRPLARFFLGRVAKVYGFFAMPAMPPDPRQSQARSAAIRRVIAYIRQSPCPMIGLAPEGRDIVEETVGWPPPGAGRFVQQMALLGLKLAPVGVFEEDGALCLRFGPPFELAVPAALPTPKLDRAIARQVMEQIARQLPSTFHFLPEENLAQLHD